MSNNLNIPSFSSTGNTVTTTQQTQEQLNTTLSSTLQERLEKHSIYYVEKNGNNEEIDHFQNLEKGNSLWELKDFINNSFLGGAHISINKKQASQVGLDMSKVMQGQKGLYMEFNYYSSKVNYVYNYHLEQEDIDALYEHVMKQFVNPPKNNKEEPVVTIINNLSKLAASIEMYKTSKLYNNGMSIKCSDKLGELIKKLECKGIKIIFNIYNLIHGIAGHNAAKYEGQINGIAQSFTNSPFKVVVSEFEGKENSKSTPKVWADMKEISLSLPTETDYMKTLKLLFKSSHMNNDFQKKLNENTKLATQIAKSSQGLYLRHFQEHITNYISSNDSFDSKKFMDGLDKYKMKSINSMSNKSLEIIDNKLIFDNIGGVKNIKNTFRKLAESILKKNDETIIKSYLLAGVPGTGKSLTAKALTNEFSEITGKKWIGIRLNISSLFDMYVGNTEKNFQEAARILDGLSKANDGRIILWIDEIEKALGSGTKSSHGVDEKLMGEILTTIEDKWMRKFVIIATVNNVMNLSAELKGRFVNKYFFDNPTEEARKSIVDIKCDEFGYEFSDEKKDLITRKTENFVGREIENLFSQIKQETHNYGLQGLNLGIFTQEQLAKLQADIYLIENSIEKEKSNIQHINSKEQIGQYREECKNFTSADYEGEEEKEYSKEEVLRNVEIIE